MLVRELSGGSIGFTVEPGLVRLVGSATRSVNVTALVTLNKSDLSDHSGKIPSRLLDDIDRGLRRVLNL
jgi:mRNA interferase MazF